MSAYRNYWLVTGRMCGDDEATAIQFEHCTRDGALEAYAEHMNGLRAGHPLELFIDGVYASDSPIEET